MALGTRAGTAMGKKRKQKDQRGFKGTNEERKTHYKIRRFYNTLRKGKTVADINHHTLRDIAGAVQILQRVAMLKSLDTRNMVKELEKQKKRGPSTEEVPREAFQDKITIANTLIAQGMHWDKVEGALTRIQCLCKNEDEILRGPWLFHSQELVPAVEALLEAEQAHEEHRIYEP